MAPYLVRIVGSCAMLVVHEYRHNHEGLEWLEA
jgi:hypothetical protein